MWNCLVIGLPVIVSIAIITSDAYAIIRANTLQAQVRQIFVRMESLKTLASDYQQCLKSPSPSSPPNFSSVPELLPLLLDLHRDSLNLTNSMQISFACWSLGGIINFAIWLPCFIIQLKIFKKQVDDENFLSQPKPVDRISPHEISLPLELGGSPIIHLDSPIAAAQGQGHAKKAVKRSQTNLSKNNSYVVFKDGKIRMRFIGILLVLFAFYGLSINLGILYQAWSTSRKSTKQTPQKAKQFHFSLKSFRQKSEETA
ncbi:hypothetical protein PGTUg99_004118 [Puccinia graminis f. sp. tritici]|uniref:Uncharacterized protein n=1 Tax=Puccinia graminis f. sp. tritici TaxID=56615 RepID=A0A5B0RJB6_PUCGR|nr:hypothetical protein PGTUg99_004118 [Puccinia graminis f. sp. tritici]